MRLLPRRRWLLVPVALLAMLAVMGYGRWREGSNRGGQLPAEPFRIAGNLYYVGANDVTAFLLAGPEGHVLIDGGYPGTAPMIIQSVEKLGFRIRDVKVLLNSHAHFDHAGGLAALQQASGAELWLSEAEAPVVAAGGAGNPSLGALKFISYLPFLRYPAPRVDRRFKDGTTIRVGPVQLTAHVTAGHTPGCTSWAIPLRDGDRELLAVSVCSLGLPPALSLPGADPEIQAEFEASFRTLRGLPADIWVTAHGRHFGRYRKFAARDTARNPVDPFIDRAGYRAFIDSAEADFRAAVADP
jgi:metallo-beta-lactamase class B